MIFLKGGKMKHTPTIEQTTDELVRDGLVRKVMSVFFVGAISLAASAFDTTGYVVLDADDVLNTTESFTGSLPGGVKWHDGGAPEPGKKYYAGYRIAQPAIGSKADPAVYSFAGDELVLGDGGYIWVRGHADNIVTVTNLVMLGGSRFHFGSKLTATYGNCTIRESSLEKPAKMSSGAHISRSGWVFEFPASLHGDADQCIAAENTWVDATSFHNHAFIGSQSNYFGTYLVKTNTSLYVASTPGQVVVEAGGEFINYYQHGTSSDTATTSVIVSNPEVASMVVEAGGMINVSRTGIVTVGDLTLKAGAKIKLASDSTTNGLVVVTGSLAVEGTVDITLGRTYNTSTGVPPSFKTIILAPGASGTIDPDLFMFSDPTIQNPRGDLPHVVKRAVTGADDSTTLVETRKEIVVLNRGYSSAEDKTESALWQAKNNSGVNFWSNGEKPQTGLDYLCYSMSVGITTPTNSAPFRFAGDSLTLSSGKNGSLTFNSGSKGPQYGLEVSHLSVENDGFLVYSGTKEDGDSSYDMRCFRILGGTMHLSGTCTFRPFGGDMLLRVESNLTGDGLLRADTYVASANGGPRGWTELTGDNTAWKGKALVTADYNDRTRDAEWGSPCPNEKLFATLVVRNERNLGGPLDAFAKDALKVNQMCMLRVVGDVDFSTANRGVMIEREARFHVVDGKTFTIGNQLTMAGVLRKEGAGTLALGGPLRFIDGEASTAPVAMTNRLRLVEGALKPMATNALDGAEIVVESDSAKFLFDAAPSADGLQAYGLVNTKWANPVVLSGASKIRVEIVPPDAAWLDEAHDGYRMGLFTVASQATAESILGNISYNKRYAKNSLALRVVQNDASSYTVEGVFTPKPGVIISVW